MNKMDKALGTLDALPRAVLWAQPTIIEELPRLARANGGARLFVKRDDMNGLAFGGNKVRQLEFYLGEAVAEGADVVLITGAVQSNFVRMAAAGARKLGMECHIQLEERVPKNDPAYRNSGNVLIDRLLGATLHSFPQGEDEAGADRALHAIAEDLKAKGAKPYVIYLSPGHPPLGALGYVIAAQEIVSQCAEQEIAFDEVIVASGSGATHAGLLFGLRALGDQVPVTGICVRRPADVQQGRIVERCTEIAGLLGIPSPVAEDDVVVMDEFLAPGYGRMSQKVADAMGLAAREEAMITDPVYTAKTLAGFLAQARDAAPTSKMLMIHTGGMPAVFAYEKDVAAAFLPDSD